MGFQASWIALGTISCKVISTQETNCFQSINCSILSVGSEMLFALFMVHDFIVAFLPFTTLKGKFGLAPCQYNDAVWCAS